MNLTTISIIEAINLPIHATNIKIIWCFCQNKLKISTQTIHNNRYCVVGIIMSVNFTTLIFFCFNIKLNSLSTHIEKVNKGTNTPLLSEWKLYIERVCCVWSRKPSKIGVRRCLWRIQLKNSYYRRFSNLTYLFSFLIYNLNNEPHWCISYCKLHFDIIFCLITFLGNRGSPVQILKKNQVNYNFPPAFRVCLASNKCAEFHKVSRASTSIFLAVAYGTAVYR